MDTKTILAKQLVKCIFYSNGAQRYLKCLHTVCIWLDNLSNRTHPSCGFIIRQQFRCQGHAHIDRQQSLAVLLHAEVVIIILTGNQWLPYGTICFNLALSVTQRSCFNTHVQNSRVVHTSTLLGLLINTRFIHTDLFIQHFVLACYHCPWKPCMYTKS